MITMLVATLGLLPGRTLPRDGPTVRTATAAGQATNGTQSISQWLQEDDVLPAAELCGW